MQGSSERGATGLPGATQERGKGSGVSEIKAIETRYKGCHFRSRLEARWAVFFDALGVEWQYEPESFYGGSGAYVPDFFLPEIAVRGRDYCAAKGVYVEVKGTDEALRRDADKIAMCIDYHLTPLADHGVLVLGDVPAPPTPGELITHSYVAWRKGVTHEDVAWGTGYCPHLYTATQLVPAWFNEEATEQLPDAASTAARVWSVACEHKSKTWKLTPNNLVARAYASARSARFEHGQSGAT